MTAEPCGLLSSGFSTPATNSSSPLDRPGRDTRDVLNIIHEVEQRGSVGTVLDPHVLTRGEIGHVMLIVLGMVAWM